MWNASKEYSKKTDLSDDNILKILPIILNMDSLFQTTLSVITSALFLLSSCIATIVFSTKNIDSVNYFLCIHNYIHNVIYILQYYYIFHIED